MDASRINDYDGNKIVLEAFKNKYTDFFVTVIGTVQKVLPDDLDGIQHQRFLLRLVGTNHTVLIVHNLKYGERLHLAPNDTFKITGEYVWNNLGGLIHLTHQDPFERFEEGTADIIKEVHTLTPDEISNRV